MTKLLVITGGSRGIGEAVIKAFQADNWQVINISRTPCNLPQVHNISIDLLKAGWQEQHGVTITKLCQQAEQICIVHNASVFYKDSIETLDAQAFRDVLEFSLVAPVALNQLIIPFMKKGSSIIYIGSTLSEMAIPGRASYIIAKHALIGLMRSTCQDLAGRGISTCCICPGFVNTEMLTSQVSMEILESLVKQKVSAGRLIEPHEIATFVQFCANHPIVNGSVLHANLGQMNQ